MEFRSKSCRDESLHIESYTGSKVTPTSMQNLRCYSANSKEVKIEKGKNRVGRASKSWSLNDPELQRKKRVAGYKIYAVEGKMKGSLRKSFRWIKNRCNQVVYGWW